MRVTYSGSPPPTPSPFLCPIVYPQTPLCSPMTFPAVSVMGPALSDWLTMAL